MVIVELDHEKSQFIDQWISEPSLIYPIWIDIERHPMNTDVSFLYVKFANNNEYILPFSHNDCMPLDIDLSQSTQSKKVYNKKGLLQTNLGITNMYDIQTELYFNDNQVFEIEPHILTLTTFYNRMGVRDNLGKIIPIMNWYSVLNELTSTITFSTYESWIDDTMIPILSDIERNGIRVDSKKFIDKWPDSSKHLNNDIIYTEYNPYTATSRPSNRHGGVNYAALNKNDGTRDIFIPRKDKIFLQFDYDAYHVRIIGKMIGYKLPDTSVHQWLADQYGCSYSDSKGVTFKILYGGVTDEYRHIPFFNEVDTYINKLYDNALKVGYIETEQKQRIYLDRIENVTPQKLFNYLLQATETEYNILIIKELRDSDLVLYAYDAFLFEYDVNGDTKRAIKIKEILESNGFPVRATWGDSYSKV